MNIFYVPPLKVRIAQGFFLLLISGFIMLGFSLTGPDEAISSSRGWNTFFGGWLVLLWITIVYWVMFAKAAKTKFETNPVFRFFHEMAVYVLVVSAVFGVIVVAIIAIRAVYDAIFGE